jgi:hypothetical protein
MLKGSKMTDEQRKRLSEAHIGKNIGHVVSEETRRKISESQKGKTIPVEQRAKISRSLKGRKMPYVSKSNSIRTISIETRNKRSLLSKEMWTNPEFREEHPFIKKGEQHPRYIKDRSLLKTDILRPYDTQYKYWMLEVKKRDGWMCRMANEDCEGKLEAHHILSWKDYPELHYKINNGITLCHAHHPRSRKDVEKLSSYFNQLVASLD